VHCHRMAIYRAIGSKVRGQLPGVIAGV
jgi:hypothetical protein